FADAPDASHLSSRAKDVVDVIQSHGASFFDEIVDETRMLPAQVEEAIAELVALGVVNSDSFGGLRALLLPSGPRPPRAGGRGRGRRMALFGMADSGRWALVRKAAPTSSTEADGNSEAARAAGNAGNSDAIENLVRTLLRRWGVILWKLLAAEAPWLPPW